MDGNRLSNTYGLVGLSDEEAATLCFVLLSRIKDPNIIQSVIIAGGIMLCSRVDAPAEVVMGTIADKMGEWDMDLIHDKRAGLSAISDQIEADFAAFKDRIRREGVTPATEENDGKLGDEG